MTQEAPEGKGVRVFPPPPKGFDPFTATKIELTRHGLPPRPDRQTLPVQAALWEHIARRYGSFEHLQPKLSSPDTPRVLATTEAGPFALDGFESCGYELFSSRSFPDTRGDLDGSQFGIQDQPLWSQSDPHVPGAWVP